MIRILSLRRHLLIWCLLTLMLAEAAFGRDRYSGLAEAIEAQMRAENIPGLAVAVVEDGKVAFSRGYGVRSVTDPAPVTPTTLFRIGSVTKTFTALAVMQLAEAGLVELDAPVQRYVPEFQVSMSITVRQLLSHTSGLADAGNDHPLLRSTNSAETFISRLTPAAASLGPGTALSYSSPGYAILGRLIERLSGGPCSEHVETKVLRKLGLADTTFSRELAIVRPVAVGHLVTADGRLEKLPSDWRPSAYDASGAAFSNVQDLARFAIWLGLEGQTGGESPITPRAFMTMTRPVARPLPTGEWYGLGLMLDRSRGELAIGHDGHAGGASAWLFAVPAKHFAMVILANRSRADLSPIVDLAMRDLAGLPLQANSRPAAAELRQAEGVYEGTDLEGRMTRISVREEGGVLIARTSAQDSGVRFVRERPDVYGAYRGKRRIGTRSFIRDEKGRITGLDIDFRHAKKTT